MLHLSTVRQHFDSGFNSVLSLVEDLKQQIESLTLANQSPNHIQHLQQTISSQKSEISRLTETIENKSKEVFKLHQSRLQFQNQFELRLSKTRQINRQLRTRIRELERLLIAGDILAPVLDSHNSNLPPSLDPPWKKPPRTNSLRRKSGRPIGGVTGHRGVTLRQTSEPDLVIVQQVNVCRHCHHSLIQIEPIRYHKRQIFEIENGGLFITMEKGLTPMEKLKFLSAQLKVVYDSGQRPVQTIDTLFDFRNFVAHCKAPLIGTNSDYSFRAE